MVKWRRCEGTPPIVQNLFLGEIQPLRHGFAVPPPLKWKQCVLCVFTVDSSKIGFSSRRSCHGVTDEVKFCGLMLFSARHCVGRHALMPPIAMNFLRLMNFNPSVTASPCLLPKS